ncbi:MAG: glycosyltransferase [Deltaproteobacteria bacterium]|nr:glycosyltransferase [Deltaproteobacteria bacterium]
MGSGATTPTLKIAYVLPNIEAGGTEQHVLTLCRLLDRSRFSPSLITTAGGGALFEAFSALVPTKVMGDPARGKRFRSTPWEHAKAVASLVRHLRERRPDIVHTYLPAANVIGPLAAQLAAVTQVIVSKRSLTDYKERFPLLRHTESFGNRLANIILVNSDAVRMDVERTERNWRGKFRKIYNGVAPIEPWSPDEAMAFRRREGIPADALVALCVSNFYPYKGHEELMEAAARVVPAYPNVIFLLAGRDSGTLEATRILVRERGIVESIRFVGSRTDVPDLLRISDLFVHPSREEGFSNAILEAMAAGLPVVACGVGGNPEVVVDGETGRLVPSRNAAAFASAIVELLADPEKRNAMGEAGRHRVTERFSLDRMMEEMESLYESLARRGR